MTRLWHLAMWICVVGNWLVVSPTMADNETITPPTSETSTDPAFEPGEITIGEPLQVPFRKPAAVVPPPDVPAGSPAVEVPRRFSTADSVRTAAPPAAATAGSGWLGITVDDSLVPGRLVVVEVAPEGPAALAGLEPQDLLLGINGSPLRTADEMAAILATISPGMTVNAAVGKGERIEERALVATKRPSPASSPGWQGSNDPSSVVTTPPLSPPVTIAPPAVLPSPRAAPLISAPPAHELPAPALDHSPQAAARGRTALGVRTVPVDAEVQARYRLTEAAGAYVIGVVADLPASKAGVPPGSVIVAIRNQPVRGPQELTRLVTSGPVGAPVPLQYVLPGGESREAAVVLQPLGLPLERALVGDDDPAASSAVGTQRAERFIPPTIAPAAASAALTLEEEVRMLRRQVDQLDRRLQRLEPSLVR